MHIIIITVISLLPFYTSGKPELIANACNQYYTETNLHTCCQSADKFKVTQCDDLFKDERNYLCCSQDIMELLPKDLIILKDGQIAQQIVE